MKALETSGPAFSAVREFHSKVNPFSSERVRPALGRFLLPTGQSTNGLLTGIGDLGGCVQIIGPHGTGKSTLLHALGVTANATGRAALLIRASQVDRVDQVHCLPPGNGILLMDEGDVLSRFRRLVLIRRCRIRGVHLVLAGHRDLRLPNLVNTQIILNSIRMKLLGELLRGYSEFPTPTEPELAHLLKKHQQNMRQVFFELYDRYERGRGAYGKL